MMESKLGMTKKALNRAKILLKCKLEYKWQFIHIKIIQLINLDREGQILKLLPII